MAKCSVCFKVCHAYLKLFVWEGCEWDGDICQAPNGDASALFIVS